MDFTIGPNALDNLTPTERTEFVHNLGQLGRVILIIEPTPVTPWRFEAKNRGAELPRTHKAHHELGCQGNDRWYPDESDAEWIAAAVQCKNCLRMRRVQEAEAA